VVHTAATSIRKLMHAGNKRAHLWENSKVLHKGLRDAGFQLGTEEPQSAIIAVIMPDLERGAAMWEALLKEGLYVNLARPPATPAGMTLLRCSLCAEHSPDQVQTILGMPSARARPLIIWNANGRSREAAPVRLRQRCVAKLVAAVAAVSRRTSR
jgi:glycine C-acetyltransferase/8-amino-7-oxononanoate synthase